MQKIARREQSGIRGGEKVEILLNDEENDNNSGAC